MFKFNLLPPERRRLRHTPLPYFIAIVLLVAVTSLGVFDLLLTVQKLWVLQKKENELNTHKTKLQERMLIYDDLMNKKGKLENRLKYISEVEAKKFIIWTQKIDQFLDILQRFPNAWIEDISINTGGGEEVPEHKGRKILAVMEIKMVMNTNNPADIVSFREAIKNPENGLMNKEGEAVSDRFDYFDPAPQWNKELFQVEQMQPLMVYKFIIKLIKFQLEKK